MASKWQVNLAVRQSSLPPASRHIMLVLSDVADPKTAVVPDERTPSLAELAVWTGYDPSTVTRHLNVLDEAGWLVRDRPDRIVARRDGVRTKYRLMVPRSALCTTGEVSDQAVDGGSVVHGASERGAQDNTPRGAQSNTSVVRDATRPVVHGAQDSYTDEVETIKSPSSSAKPPKAPKVSKLNENRPDVERLCAHLADRIQANGSKRPSIGVKWRTAARLLLDADGRTEEQVHKAIDWCQNDEFWRGNILSMPKLREQYDQLRLQAMRANGRASPQREQLTEVNGLMLGERNLEAIERNKRMKLLQEAKDAGQTLSIEGRAA